MTQPAPPPAGSPMRAIDRQRRIHEVIGRLREGYVRERHDDERFIDTFDRIGLEAFKTHVYATPIPGQSYQAGEDAYA